MMKKILLGLMAVVASMGLVSCGEDDDNNGGNDASGLPAAERYWVGAWYEERCNSEGLAEYRATWTFNADHSCTYVVESHDDLYQPTKSVKYGQWSYDEYSEVLTTDLGYVYHIYDRYDASWVGFLYDNAEMKTYKKGPGTTPMNTATATPVSAAYYIGGGYKTRDAYKLVFNNSRKVSLAVYTGGLYLTSDAQEYNKSVNGTYYRYAARISTIWYYFN